MTITFLATTDIHGHVEAESDKGQAPSGGLSLVAGYVANARAAAAERGGAVVLLDAGDMMQGTLVSNLGEGRAVVRAMNAMGYAAAAVGNHEFDYGPVGPHVVASAPADDPLGALKARVSEAHYPWLTSNLHAPDGGPIAPSVREFAIVDAGGVKVGIVGGTSEDTKSTTLRPNVAALQIEPLATSIPRAAAAARAAGATVVVAVIHEGGDCKRNDVADDLESCKKDAPIMKLARELPAGTVDAIFAGHTHQAVAHRVAGVPILQAYSNARALSRFDLRVDKRTGQPLADGGRLYPPQDVCAVIEPGVGGGRCRDAALKQSQPALYEGRPVVADAQVAQSIADDVAAAEKKKREPIGVTIGAPVQARYNVESALGDLAADALRRAGKTEIGMINGGGLRADLPSGALTYGALFEAFPFDNKLATVKVTGAALRKAITRNMASDKGILSFSGIDVRASCSGSQLDVKLSRPDGKVVRDEDSLTLSTIDFLVRGGDGFVEGGHAQIDESAPLLREIMADELRRRGPRIDGGAAIFDEHHPRIAMPGPRPIVCSPAR